MDVKTKLDDSYATLKKEYGARDVKFLLRTAPDTTIPQVMTEAADFMDAVRKGEYEEIEFIEE